MSIDRAEDKKHLTHNLCLQIHIQHTHTLTCTHTLTRTHTYTRTQIHTHKYTHTHTHVNIHMYTCTHSHIHKHTHCTNSIPKHVTFDMTRAQTLLTQHMHTGFKFVSRRNLKITRNASCWVTLPTPFIITRYEAAWGSIPLVIHLV